MRLTDDRTPFFSTTTVSTEAIFRYDYERQRVQVDREPSVRKTQNAFAVSVLPPVNADLEVCAAKLVEAKKAVTERKLRALHWALGPEVYLLAQEYKDATRRNYLSALNLVLEHAISRRRQRIYLDLAQRHNHPTKLRLSQQIELRTALIKAFDRADNANLLTLPAAWELDLEFSDLYLEMAAGLLREESRKCLSEKAISDLPKALFDEKKHAAGLQIDLTDLGQRQINLHCGYEKDVKAAWGVFESKFKRLNGESDQRIAELKACGITELPFFELVGGAAVFDSAIQAYVSAGTDQEKGASLACLQVLVAHGAQCSAVNVKYLDWPALAKLLSLGAAPTARVKAVRDTVTEQFERRAGLFAWFFRLRYSSEAQAKSLRAAQATLVVYLMARKEPFSADQERQLLLAAAPPKMPLRTFDDRAPLLDAASEMELQSPKYGT